MNMIKRIAIAAVMLLVLLLAVSCGHKHNLTKVDKLDATCTEAGTEAYYTCDGCDKIFADANGEIELEAPKAIEALGHKIVGLAGTAATCTEAGTKDCYKCTACDTLFSDAAGENAIEAPEALEALSHTFVKTEAKDATCTENGNKAYYFCSVCKKLYADEEGTTETTLAEQVIPASGHSLAKTEAKDATCTENGNIAYWTCGNCKNVYSDAEGKNATTLADTVIGAKGHNYGTSLVIEGAVTTYEPGDSFNTANLSVKLACSACDNTVAVTNYTISKTENLQPNDSEIVISYVDGDKTYTATVKVTVKHEHTTGDLVPAVEPTCTEKGAVAYYECTVCHEKFEDKAATKPLASIEVPANGHSGVKTEAKAATCTEAGNNAYWTCGVCIKVFSDEACTNETTVDAEQLPVADHDTEVKSDADGHWDDCKNCDYTTEKAAHDGIAYPDAKPTCEVCGTEFGVASSDGWVHYAPGVVYADYYEAIDGTVDGENYINYELITLENGMNATKFTVAAGTPANASTAVWNDQNLLHNIKVPVRAGGTKAIAYITNNGTQDITVTVGQVDSAQDKGSGTVLVPAGETVSVPFTVTGGAPKGNNTWFAVRDAVESETSFTVWGYFNVEDDIKELSIKTPASKLTFKVGETFSAEGLRLAIAALNENATADYGEFEIYSNFTTNFDGKVFAASDVGMHTVTVSFAGATATYNVVVENDAHTHNIVYVPYKAATCTVDGNTPYYMCDGEGCGQLYADAEGNTPISADSVVIAKGHANVILPGTREYCARCGETLGDEVMSGEHWVLFRPEKEVGEGSFAGWKAEYTDVDGVYGSMFTFGAGVNAGDRIKLTMWNEQGNFQTIIPNGLDADVANRTVIMYYHNYGTEAITIKFQNDSNDSIYNEVTIPAGGIVASTFEHPKSGGGSNWFYLQVQNDIQSDVTVGVYGYFYLANEFDSVSIVKNAEKLSFATGETFTTKGLMLKTSGGIKTTFVETGYTTDLDSYVFTADDIGAKTVTVSFGGKTATYEIEVTAHKHSLEIVEGKDAVKCTEDGVEDYYKCTIEGCDEIFSDAEGNNKISAPIAISCHVATPTLPGYEIVCADCNKAYAVKDGSNWVFYNITTNYNNNGVVNGKLESADIDGVSGTMIYIGAGTAGGTGNNFQLCMGDNDANKQTVIPNLGDGRQDGDLRHVIMFYKNYSNEAVTLNLQNDGQGGNGKVTIPAGGTIISEFDIHNVGGSNWFNLYIDSDVTTDVQIGAYGYIYVNDGEVNEISANTEGCDLTFKVGDSFSAEGLVLSAPIPSSNTKTLYVTTGYTTSLDGVVFDEAGEYEVTVTFAGVTTKYTITVEE